MIADTHLETALFLLATVLATVKIVQFWIIWERFNKEEKK